MIFRKANALLVWPKHPLLVLSPFFDSMIQRKYPGFRFKNLYSLVTFKEVGSFNLWIDCKTLKVSCQQQTTPRQKQNFLELQGRKKSQCHPITSSLLTMRKNWKKGNVCPEALEMSDRERTKIQFPWVLLLRPQRRVTMTSLAFEIIEERTESFQPL